MAKAGLSTAMMESTTLLIAENNPTALETSKEYFIRYEGPRVIPAETPGEARILLKHGKEKPDAVILDARLTDDKDDMDRSGLDLAEELVAAEPDASFPIIL